MCTGRQRRAGSPETPVKRTQLQTRQAHTISSLQSARKWLCRQTKFNARHRTRECRNLLTLVWGCFGHDTESACLARGLSDRAIQGRLIELRIPCGVRNENTSRTRALGNAHSPQVSELARSRPSEHKWHSWVLLTQVDEAQGACTVHAHTLRLDAQLPSKRFLQTSGIYRFKP